MNTTTSAVPYALSLTVTGTSGTLTHTASTTLMVTLAPADEPERDARERAGVAVVGGLGRGVRLPGEALDRERRSVRRRWAARRARASSNTGLTNGTTYHYVVSATYTGGPVAGGASANSSQASATPQAARHSRPRVSPRRRATPRSSLSWNASSGATSYNVKRCDRVRRAVHDGGQPGATSYTDSGLTNGTTYFYVVTAVNASGESGNSAQVSATPQGVVPAPPTGRHRDAGQHPGVAELERLLGSDELQREALDRVRRAVHARSSSSQRDELHRLRAHQRHHLLLRRHRGERVRGERELRAGERHAAGGRSGCRRRDSPRRRATPRCR